MWSGRGRCFDGRLSLRRSVVICSRRLPARGEIMAATLKNGPARTGRNSTKIITCIRLRITRVCTRSARESLRAPKASTSLMRTATRFSTACRDCGASTPATAGRSWSTPQPSRCKELPYYNNFFQCAHPPSIELAALLQEVSPPQFNRVFFAGSGFGVERHDRAHGANLLGPDGPAASAIRSSVATMPITAQRLRRPASAA